MWKKTYVILFLIFLAAALLRFIGLTTPDVINDEALIGFRSIGLIDYFAAPNQTTPWQWFDEVPGWTKIINHDHPPVVFWLQHWSMKIFGQNLFGLRLPSVLFGVLTVYLLFLLGKRIADENTGLLAAIFGAVNVYLVWISKIGLQESIVIALMLLAIYLALRSRERPNLIYWAFAVAGVGVLSKYTAISAVIIILFYLLVSQKQIFKEKRIYLSLLLFLLIISPIIIYNIFLYRSVGHFDLQFSFLLGQNPEVWQNLPGKEQIGSFADRIIDFGSNLFKNGSYIFTIFALISLIYSVIIGVNHIRRTKVTPDSTKKSLIEFSSLLYISLFIIFFLLLVVGARERFLAMIIPFLILLVAVVFKGLKSLQLKYYIVIKILLGMFLAFELFYTYNTTIKTLPTGPSVWAHSELEADNRPWGYNDLNKYLDMELGNSYPRFQLPARYAFLEEIKTKSITNAQADGKIARPLLIVYDENINNNAGLWYIIRRVVYDGWPIITSGAYLDAITQSPEIFSSAGITEIIFIKATDNTLLESERSSSPNSLEQQLTEAILTPHNIVGPQDLIYFKVYKF